MRVRNAITGLKDTLEGKSGVAAACFFVLLSGRSRTRASPAGVFNFAQTPRATLSRLRDPATRRGVKGPVSALSPTIDSRRTIRMSITSGSTQYVSHSILPSSGCFCADYQRQCCGRTNLRIATCNKIIAPSVRPGFVEALHCDPGRDLDNHAVGGGEGEMGQR